MINPIFATLWVLLFAAMAALEITALVRKPYGDTLSELVWFILRKSIVFKAIMGLILIWVFIHFIWLGVIV